MPDYAACFLGASAFGSTCSFSRLGGGKPFFTVLDRPIALRLAETRAFPGGVVLLRYERA